QSEENVERKSMKRHMWTHIGEKPYGYPTCNRNFSHLSIIKNHMRTHTSEKPYSCPMCNKSFRQRRHLQCPRYFMMTGIGQSSTVIYPLKVSWIIAVSNHRGRIMKEAERPV
ncbi:zinc finger protein, partial [Loa loa]